MKILNELAVNDNAEKILSEFIEEVLHIIMDTRGNDFSAVRCVLPWLEEDAENSIKALRLPADDERLYIHKINNFMGKYSDSPPVENN